MLMRTAHTAPMHNNGTESPDYVRLSLAAAMTLDFVPGWFYRNAKLGCINLLLTYDDGCRANCAFCGLARENESNRKFIRVAWKPYPMSEILERLKSAPAHVGRVCISMITNPRCKEDVLSICRRISRESGLSVSLLISPTLLKPDDLKAMRDAGADRIGVAIDAATEEIFDRLRGSAVRGPHRWDPYWKIYEQSLEVFGQGMAGVHLICGLGETEQEMASTMWRARSMGGCTHLFSFFPEKGSAMASLPSPPVGTYRRIQLTRWLMDNDRTTLDAMEFNDAGRIVDYGVPEKDLHQVIVSGSPFETSGCPGPDGRVACNRPFGNEKPGLGIRNFPFPPEEGDVERIIGELQE